jgi:hypothetical protein
MGGDIAILITRSQPLAPSTTASGHTLPTATAPKLQTGFQNSPVLSIATCVTSRQQPGDQLEQRRSGGTEGADMECAIQHPGQSNTQARGTKQTATLGPALRE